MRIEGGNVDGGRGKETMMNGIEVGFDLDGELGEDEGGEDSGGGEGLWDVMEVCGKGEGGELG